MSGWWRNNGRRSQCGRVVSSRRPVGRPE